jgi:hypothetical protein
MDLMPARSIAGFKASSADEISALAFPMLKNLKFAIVGCGGDVAGFKKLVESTGRQTTQPARQ